MFELNIRKLAQKAHYLGLQLLQLRLLCLVLAGHLLDDKLRVEIYLQAIRLPSLHRFESIDQRVVFGLVVRCDPKPPMECAKPHALVIFDHDANAGGSWIATRSAVSAQPQNLQDITRIRPQFSQLTIWSPLRNACI